MKRFLGLYREASARSIPLEVMLELTHHCNFRCQHCYIPDFDLPNRLSRERILDLLDELAEMGTLVLALSGGEVMLRRDWPDIARRARELSFALHVFTNGWAVGDEQADVLAEVGAKAHVSFYSRDAATFDAITKRPGSYAKVVAAIERLRARGVPMVLKVPLMTLNYRDTAGIRAWAAEIGAEYKPGATIYAKKDGDRTPLALRVPHEELVAELGGPLLGCYAHDVTDGPMCAAASRFCCITAAGDVTACTILPGSDSNIRDRAFRDVWENSPWLQKIRGIRRADLRTCDTCPRLSYCGRCHAQALAEDGDLYGPSRHAQQRADLIDSGWAGHTARS